MPRVAFEPTIPEFMKALRLRNRQKLPSAWTDCMLTEYSIYDKITNMMPDSQLDDSVFGVKRSFSYLNIASQCVMKDEFSLQRH
jgi:hypothetical protein